MGGKFGVSVRPSYIPIGPIYVSIAGIMGMAKYHHHPGESHEHGHHFCQEAVDLVSRAILLNLMPDELLEYE